jgi:uncharacterized protein DUF2785
MVRCLTVAMALLAACATPRACPVVEPAHASVPPADDARAKWLAVAESKDMAPPAGTTMAAALPELVAYLGSPDPVRRDHIGYEVLARWISSGKLVDADARELARKLRDNLAPAPEVRDGVFLRSFSALVLAEIVRRDRKTPFLSDDDRRAILKTAHDYAERETDLRGHTGDTGWAHAAAHTADLLASLARLPAFTDADRAQILDATASFVTRRHGQILAYGEDGRLAVSVVAAAAGGLSAEAIDAWIAKLKAPLVEPATHQFDAALFAAKRNARNLLFSVYVQISAGDAESTGERLLFEKVLALIRE